MRTNQKERETVAAFAARYKVGFVAEPADANPNMEGMPARSLHWRCTLRVGTHRMLVPFSQGPPHTRAPTVVDVLDCLASDSSSYENDPDFESWASSFGYEVDSRKAERTFKLVERQAKALRRLLGDEAYEELLWHTERE